jgi:uncharacterized repeat protein (TIGR01451 family)
MKRTVAAALVPATVLAAFLGVGAAAAQSAADLSILKSANPDPVAAGSSLVYTLTVSNKGPDDAAAVTVDDPLPAETTFVSLAAPAGWSCADPGAGNNGLVSCSIASLPAGSAVFTLTVAVGAGVANGTVIRNTAAVTSSTPDPNPGAESAAATVTVISPAVAIGLTKTDAPDPVLAGEELTYTLTAANNTGADLEEALLSDPLPAGTTFVSLTAPAGWSCTQPAVGSGGTVSCSAAPFVPGAAAFTLVVKVDAGSADGALGNVAELTVTDSGRDTTVSAASTTQVRSLVAVLPTKSVSGSLFFPGTDVTYTIVLFNPSGQMQSDNPGDELTDLLPPQLTLLSAAATSGAAVANLATNTVTWNGSLPGGGTATITIQAKIKSTVPPSTVVTNQAAVVYDANGDGVNESAALTDDPFQPGGSDPTVFVVQTGDSFGIPTLSGFGIAVFALLLAALGAALLRDRASPIH